VAVNPRVLVAGEPDESQLACLACLHQRLDGAAGREATLGIVVADYLVDLDEIDHLRL